MRAFEISPQQTNKSKIRIKIVILIKSRSQRKITTASPPSSCSYSFASSPLSLHFELVGSEVFGGDRNSSATS